MQDAINISLIGGKLEYLDGLCIAKKQAADQFKEACKVIGQEARVEAAVLAAFINSRISETTDKQNLQAEQMSLLFDEIGL